ncbi:hypothetical protein ACFXKG_01245 [Streptomyces sp. NPDC059255]
MAETHPQKGGQPTARIDRHDPPLTTIGMDTAEEPRRRRSGRLVEIR